MRQCEALALVAAGRVTFGDPHPALTTRRVEAAERRVARGEADACNGRERPVTTRRAALAGAEFMVDGVVIYGGQHATYGALSDREWILAAADPVDGTARPVTLTAVGRAALKESQAIDLT
jgi:hypothetical protein